MTGEGVAGKGAGTDEAAAGGGALRDGAGIDEAAAGEGALRDGAGIDEAAAARASVVGRRARRQRARVGSIVVGGLLALVVTVVVARRLVTDWQALQAQGLIDSLHFDPVPIAVAWFVQTAGFVVMVAAWRGLLGADARHVRYVTHLKVHAVSGLAHLLPGSIWAPASRIVLYHRLDVPPVTVGAALVYEWLLVGLAGVVLYGVSAPWSHAAPPRVAGGTAVAAVAALACLHPAIAGRLIRRVAGRLDRPAPDVLPTRQMLRLLAAEVVVLVLAGLGLTGVMAAVSPTTSFPDALAAFALSTSVASFLAWLPGTGVVREATFVLLLAPVYGSSVVALAVSLVWRVWLVIVQISWAALGIALDRIAGRQAV